jgi:putative endonuclease
MATPVVLSCCSSEEHADLAAICAGKRLARRTAMLKRFVYVLRNGETPPRYYTGLTSDVAARCAAHNAGDCSHTSKHRPWAIDVVIEFADQPRAVAFERYLKSGSGVAFAQRHLRSYS